MCLDSAVRVYKKPIKEKRIGYKVKSVDNYSPIHYKYNNSDSFGKLEYDNGAKEYEPGFHILPSRKAAIKLARAINKLYKKRGWDYDDGYVFCIFKVEYNHIVAEGYENCSNIAEYASGRCKCDVARRMKVLEKIEV